MRKIFCKIEEKYSSYDGDTVLLFEGPEIQKEEGVKRFFITEDGYKRFDNFDEWTIEVKEGPVIPYYALHLNPFSKPHKPQVITGSNFCFIG